MVALLGVAALSLDASFMYDKRNRLHAAADAAAKSAAIEVIRNPSVSQGSLEAFADQQVVALGFSPSRLGGTTTVVINHGPASGPFAGDPYYVEAVVSEPTSTFFGKVLGWTSMTPGARAVAGAGNPSACVIVNEDLTIGNTNLNLNGCGVAVGGDLYGNNPNSRITGIPTPPVGVTGTCIAKKAGVCANMGNLVTGAPFPTDPLAGLPLPTDPGGCVAGVAATLSPGCYSSIGPTVTNLLPGDYYVTGTVDQGHNGSLTGTNVLIFLTGSGHLTAGNNSEIHLTAQTTGPYTGIAIFQDPLTTNSWDTGNNFLLDVAGAIYMPGTDVDFPNALTFGSTTCTMFVTKSLRIRNGNGLLKNSGCAGLFGGAAFLQASVAR